MKLNIEKLGWNLLLGSVLAISVAGVANADDSEWTVPKALAWIAHTENVTSKCRAYIEHEIDTYRHYCTELDDIDLSEGKAAHIYMIDSDATEYELREYIYDTKKFFKDLAYIKIALGVE